MTPQGINDLMRLERIRTQDRLDTANEKITKALRILRDSNLTHAGARNQALEVLNGKEN